MSNSDNLGYPKQSLGAVTRKDYQLNGSYEIGVQDQNETQTIKNYDSFVTAKNTPEMIDQQMDLSYFSKQNMNNFESGKNSYVDQFNESQTILAVGDVTQEQNPDEEKMKELREFFKKKIANAYNSIYHERPGMLLISPLYRPSARRSF